MADPRFFNRAGPFALGELAHRIGAALSDEAVSGLSICDVAPIDRAEPNELIYLSDRRYVRALEESRASACIVSQKLEKLVPSRLTILRAPDAALSYIRAAQLFYPPVRPAPGIDRAAKIDPSARLGAGVTIEAGVTIGPGAEIGRDVVIGANSVIGRGVAIGQGCVIGPNVTISHALIGDRVQISAGACLGQDGFGYAMGPGGHAKIPQLGRVIVQDDVEIGANATIDRGSGSDTVIGQGTKIDNLVQIGHNVQIGRGCVLAAQTGISGSSVVGDFVVMGGRVGLADHVTIGNGAQIAAASGVMRDIAAGEVHAGIPARPIREFMREVAVLSRLAAKDKRPKDE